MREPKRFENKFALWLLGSALAVFGAYLVYEKVALAILSGVTEDRAGLTDRADEPILFWISVLMFAVFGGVICVFGLWALWNAIRAPKR